jgi:2,3-bisphosphoglycerate-dependent phosphoglycerate mutase
MEIKMNQLILLRHGQSMWNLDNRFTGWVDVPLSKQGVEEALQAGKQLASQPIDVVYTSTLIRAQHTAMLVMSQHQSKKTPIMQHESELMHKRTAIYAEHAKENSIAVIADWHLNERYYGELQGCNKAETIEKYGKDQVHIWRRSFDVPPPKGESLKMTCERTIPYFEKQIMPRLAKGENILLAAHGNSLRSIIMQIENLSAEEILSVEVATGVPIIYNFDGEKLTIKLL